MSAVDWEEVKRLAADFQRAQLSSSAQRLSERNCIEIIARLVEEKLLDVIFTTDGKEYITPYHLLKEIKDELYVSGGRINLVDLAKNLTVDLHVVTKRATDIEKTDSTIRIINGQLISNAYVASLCSEINEKLQQQGQISIADLTVQYDLPSEFLLSAIEKQLGHSIHGIQDKQDREILFTSAFVEKNLSIVRGALLAITRPIQTTTLINLIGVPERIFFSALDSMAEKKELPGVFTGKQKSAGSYVPYLYTKAQQDYVINFYQNNGYVEFESMIRLGISDPAGFVQKTLSKANPLVLNSVAVGPVLIDQVEAVIDEAVASGSFSKIAQVLPSVFEDRDAEQLLKKVLQKKNFSPSVHIFNSTVVVSEKLMKNLIDKYEEKVEKLAKNYVSSGEYLKHLIEKSSSKIAVEEKVDTKQDRKDERRKKASEGKSGGGAQGRETKTKSTKKKYLKGRHQQQEDSDEEVDRSSKVNQKVEVVTRDDILAGLEGEEIIKEEEDDNLLEEIADYLQPLLNRKGVELAHSFYESTIASANQTRRKKHQELQDKLSDLLLNTRLFEKGIKQFDNADISTQLVKYLLKTVGTDITNEIFAFVGERNDKELTTEHRLRIAAEATGELKELLTKLHKTLAGASIEDFLVAAETAAGPSGADIMVYKHDKKKERPQMLNQRELLLQQLNIADDPALVLHLTVLIVFHAATQNILHASGKFVSSIISVLRDKISNEDYEALRSYHDLVLQYLSNTENRGEAGSALQNEMPKIKKIAIDAKKNAIKSKERTTST